MILTDTIDINKQWVKEGAFIHLTANQRRIWRKTTYAGMIGKGYYSYTAPAKTALQKEVDGFIPLMQGGVKVGETKAVVDKTAKEISEDAAKKEEARKNGIRSQCTNHIENTLGWDKYRKENTDAGIYLVKFKVALDAVRSASIEECNRCEDDPAAIPVWPVAPDALSYEEAKL